MYSKTPSSAGSARPNVFSPQKQGCQMVYFRTKNPNLGKFWRALCRREKVDIF
jgi:hypothetical protein